MLSNPSLIRAVTAGTPLAGSSALQGEDAVYHNFSCEIQWNLSQADTIEPYCCMSAIGYPCHKGYVTRALCLAVCGEKGYNKLEYCQVLRITLQLPEIQTPSHTKSYVFNNLHSI